ncbi:Splicing factor [Dirofilaria immitis]
MTGTERKVFQKYYPPDFDPSKIPRAKGQRNRQFVQRVMAPYNMQCDTCHEYIYKGKKFNMRRETAEGETYLGLKIFRFYFRCPNCLAEITFKTDLQNCDYQQEHGATRLFEAFKLYQQEEKAKETKEEEEKKDPMKMLEKRTKMSRAEMEALGKLEELQETNRRHETFGPDQYFQNLIGAQAEALRLQEEEDEKFIQKLYGRMKDDIANVKPSTAGQSIMMAHKRTSQKELLSRIVDIKKQRTGRNESVIVKTENQDTNNSFEDTPEYSKLKKIEKNRKLSPVSLAPQLSALQSLADYCSDSNSD